MTTPRKQFKFSGRIAPQDPFHQFTTAATPEATPDEHYLAPTTINVNIVVPPGTGTIGDLTDRATTSPFSLPTSLRTWRSALRMARRQY